MTLRSGKKKGDDNNSQSITQWTQTGSEEVDEEQVQEQVEETVNDSSNVKIL